LALIALLPATAMRIYNEIDFRRARLADLHADVLRGAQLAASEVEKVVDGVRAVLITVSVAPVATSGTLLSAMNSSPM